MRGLTFSVVVITSLALAPTQAAAVDFTECGQVVDDQRGRVVNLVADLDCSDPNQWNSRPFDDHAISLWHGATLNLNGFSLIGPAGPPPEHTAGVVCWYKCRINGPGTIEGFETGIEIKYGRVIVTDVNITGAWRYGVGRYRSWNRGPILLRNTTVTGSGQVGIIANKVLLRNTTVSGNAGIGIAAIRLAARDSIVVSNEGDDINVTKRARLIRTTFGTCSPPERCPSR